MLYSVYEESSYNYAPEQKDTRVLTTSDSHDQ